MLSYDKFAVNEAFPYCLTLLVVTNVPYLSIKHRRSLERIFKGIDNMELGEKINL